MLDKNIFVPPVTNEPVKNYRPGSPERKKLSQAIKDARSEEVEVPMWIGGKGINTGSLVRMSPPHEHKYTLGHFHQGNETHVEMAIKEALESRTVWTGMNWEHRASVFLRAAELIAGPYRARMNAATMIGQSKNVHQAEIDSACELVDFLRFNVKYMEQIMLEQPYSPVGTWNRTEQRPLEGFVFALTPFNFTSIAGNLPTAPAIMGNTVVWKPSRTQVYSARVFMNVLREAGLPDGVINMILVSGPVAGKVILNHHDFAGIHFTGSTEVFQGIWKMIGKNIGRYRTYPRMVGETGGKNFLLAHPSAVTRQVVTAMLRGAFEYQGQKCSAVSRAYMPSNLWPEIKKMLQEELKSFRMGPPEDFSNFFNAVIDQASFDKLTTYIDQVQKDRDADIIMGGHYDKSEGYYIEPTVVLSRNPKYVTMVEELFGPVLTVFVYNEKDYAPALDLVDETSPYGLTGALFATDRLAIEQGTLRLSGTAGNFYINDKPTGAIIGQQPFGGGRASGTNDKAGSVINMLRWVSPRSVKENFLPPEEYRYPFLEPE